MGLVQGKQAGGARIAWECKRGMDCPPRKIKKDGRGTPFRVVRSAVWRSGEFVYALFLSGFLVVGDFNRAVVFELDTGNPSFF
jgi:hypothetical protein